MRRKFTWRKNDIRGEKDQKSAVKKHIKFSPHFARKVVGVTSLNHQRSVLHHRGS